MTDNLANRPIRFWDNTSKKMVSADEAANAWSLLAVGLHGTPIAVDADGFKKNGEVVAWNIDHNRFRMDAIGRQDKKGVEIFEFDILRTSDGSVQFVRYIPSVVGYGMSFLSGGTTSIPLDVEVIGNVFEHSRLLS